VPAVAAFGLNILSLKFLMTLCHAAFLCAFFLLARTRFDPAKALLVTALVAFNPLWLQAQNEILSDLPFALFSTLALWLIVRGPGQEDPSPRSIGAALLEGLVLFMAAFTRWTGLLLLGPLLLTQVWQLRRQSQAGVRLSRLILPAAVPYATFAMLYALQAWLFPSVGYPLQAQFAEFTQQTPWANAAYYFRLAADFFGHVFGGGRVILVALLFFYLLSLVKRGSRDLAIHVYLLATLAVLLAFPAHGGPRFLYPIWPLFVLFAFDGLMWIMDALREAHQIAVLPVGYAAWGMLVLISLVACVQAASANIAAGRLPPRAEWGAFSPTSMEMYDFVRSHTAAESVVVFFKPRLMLLMTGRDSILVQRCNRLGRGDYLILARKTGLGLQISPHDVPACNAALSEAPVFVNDDFLAYKIAPLH
jgi:4-amino-4-deoxy-L-arabinose transferase-like glycosyltransferase